MIGKMLTHGVSLQALVSGVPRDALILLDLYAEVSPLWKRTQSFYGAPFIYCMLHNFGGNIEMYGAIDSVAQGPAEAMAAQTGMHPFCHLHTCSSTLHNECLEHQCHASATSLYLDLKLTCV